MTVYTGQIFPSTSPPGFGEVTTIEFTTGLIPPGETLELEVVTPRSYQLNSVVTSSPCWLRVYGTAYARTQDERVIPGPPFPDAGTGFSAEVLTVGGNLSANLSPPAEVQTDNIYTLFKVRNDSGSPQEIQITLGLVLGVYGIVPTSPPYGCNTDVDTRGQTDLSEAWKDCDKITQLPLFDLSSVTNLESAWENCTSLQFVPPGLFDNCPATNLTNAFTNCSLTSDSVDNILLSLDAAGGENGTVDLTGGDNSPPSLVGVTAKANLEAKLWTVNTTPLAEVSFVDIGDEAYSLTSFGDGRVFVGGYSGYVYKSVNYGIDFDAGTSVGADTVYSIAACQGNTVIAGTWYDSFYWITTDNGVTWEAGVDFNQSEIDSVAHIGGGVIYIGTSGYVHKSIDNGLTWIESEPFPGGDYYMSFAFPGANKVVVGTYGDGYISYSFDGGTTWSSTTDGVLDGVYGSMVLASNGAGVVIAGTDEDGRIFRSVDSGVTWDAGTQLGAATAIYSVTCSPDGVFYAGTDDDGKIYKSDNSGVTWEEFFDPGISGGYVYSLTLSGDNTVLAGIDTYIYSIPTPPPAQKIPVTQIYPTSSVPSDLVKSNVTDIAGATPIANIVSMTQADYDALPSKDPFTLYVIIN